MIFRRAPGRAQEMIGVHSFLSAFIGVPLFCAALRLI
jgi:hypothetical protein